MEKREKFIQHIVDFTNEEVLEFLNEHLGEEFYSFAFDVNPQTHGIYLSFNTLEAFNKSLSDYQASEFSSLYSNVEQVKRLKYNPGDWKYQNFVSIEFIYFEKIKELFDVELDPNSDDLLNFAEIAMRRFRESLVYAQIPKTKDFIAFCIDHEEDELMALERAVSIN